MSQLFASAFSASQNKQTNKPTNKKPKKKNSPSTEQRLLTSCSKEEICDLLPYSLTNAKANFKKKSTSNKEPPESKERKKPFQEVGEQIIAIDFIT